MNKINLKFNKEKHKYYDDNTGQELISATTLLGKYKDKFNTYYWSMYTGLKNANIKVKHEKKELYITVNNIKIHINNLYKNNTYRLLAEKTQKKWEQDTKRSHIRGNKTHDYLEDTINQSREDNEGLDNKLIKPLKDIKVKDLNLTLFKTKNDLDKTDLKDNYYEIYLFLLEYIKRGCTIFAEKKIYNSRYLVAGMIDVLVVKGKKFAIVDWKTNKDKIHFKSGYYKKEKINGEWIKSNNYINTKDKLKYPFNKLDNCKGIVYSLQLSLYAYLMECWGYTLVSNGLNIFHFRPNRKPIKLNINYYKEEIYNMLEHYYSMNNKDTLKKEKNLRENLKLGIL